MCYGAAVLTASLSRRLACWVRCHRASGLLFVIGLMLGCGSARTPELPRSDSSTVVAHAAEQKPTLVTIERHGDRYGALALVVAHGGNSHTGRALARHFERVLFDAGWSPKAISSMVFADALAIRLTFPDDGERAGQSVEALLQALRAPIETDSLPKSPPVRDDCGIVGDPLSAPDALEQLSVQSLALGAVAAPSSLARVVAGYERTESWPQGEPRQWSDPRASSFVVDAESAAPWLSVSLHTPERQRVTDAARRLRDRESTLALLVESWGSTWQLERTTAVFRPGGACLAARLSASKAVEAPLAGYLARAVQEELARTLTVDALPTDPRLEALSASDPADAATQAAWEQLTTAGPVRKEAVAQVTLAGVTAEADELEAGFNRPTPSLPLESREEPGQGRLWVLLSSPCATLHEASASAGHTAAALISAAQRHPQTDATTLQPWLSNRGLGLIATIPTHYANAADRLAEALAKALFRGIARPEGIAATRSELTAARPPSPSWDLALKLATAGRPSLLVPYGTEASLAELSPLAAERALRAFLSSPLHLTILTPHEAHAERATDRLRRLLSGFGRTRSECPRSGPPSKLAGEYVVMDGPPEAVLLYSIDPEQYEPMSHAVRWLNGSAGWLQRAVERPKLATTAHAFALGSPNGPTALGIAIRSDADSLGPAIMQVRALLRELATLELTEEQLNDLEPAPNDTASEHWPPPRLLEAALGSAKPVDAKQLRRFFQELSDERLVLVRPPTADEQESQ